MFRSILALILFASPVAAQDAATQARVALALAAAQTPPASACDCPITGVCTCPQCPCGLSGYLAVWHKAQAEGKPFVIFAGVPGGRRDVPGVCTIGYEKWCSKPPAETCYVNRVIVCRAFTDGSDNFTYKALPPDATDRQILDTWRAIEKYARADQPLALRAGEHSHKCSVCGTEWGPHTSASYGNVHEHTCPSCGAQSWQPYRYGSALRVSAAPMFSRTSCPT